MYLKAYYGARFSPNMTKTPENYLICHNVPIARTGWYEYLGQELGLDENRDEVIKVYRSPEEVFSNASIASFEGKPVTDEHPPTDVRPDNYTSYLKGLTTNVRKGTAENSDCLVADLIIYDPKLQSEIEAGKREVSCGYDCTYDKAEEGQYKQRQICGNHVAIVTKGRAGSRVAIKDSTNLNPETERSMVMAAKKENNFLMQMFKAFAKDADPEDIKLAMDEITGLEKTPEEPANVEPVETEDDGLEDILSRLNDIELVLAKIVSAEEPVEEAKDELTVLEEELGKTEDGEELDVEETNDESEEESVTIPPEEITTDSDEEETDPTEKPTTDSRKALRDAVKAMKPVIAAIKDTAERKRATDALVRSVRGQMAEDDKNYSKLLKPTSAAKDAAMNTNKNKEFGEKCAERNPHSKGGK